MEKRGISAIVATVLVILITVAGVGIIWVGIVPMITESIAFEGMEGRVSVVSGGGYTVYDASREVAIVQVKREPDEGVMDRIKVSFMINGNSVSSNVVAPESGGVKTYSFDLSGYGEPESVGVAPIFVSGSGSEKEGSVSSVKISGGRIEKVRGNVYGIGVDAFDEVPMDGLVSIWTFSGDADDGWGENHGELKDGASIVDGELDLDGTDRVDVPDDDSLDFRTDDHTDSVWFKTSQRGGIFRHSGSYHSGEWIDLRATGEIWAKLGKSDAWIGTPDSPLSYIDGEWHHVVTLFDRDGDMIVYVDNVEVTSADISSYDGEDIANSDFLRIGRGLSGVFHGRIDNVMVYNRLLSLEEIGAIYEAQRKS